MADDIEKHAGGRPSKYEERFCDLLIADMAEGFSVSAFAGSIGVCRATINVWAKEHPEFLEALSCGKAKRLRFWEQTAISVAAKGTGGPGAASVITFGLKNMGDDEWTDTTKHDVGGKVAHEHVFRLEFVDGLPGGDEGPDPEGVPVPL
jgi:transposase